MDLQIVAFPQSGVRSAMPGSNGVVALLRHALAAGADVVGGLDPRGIDGEVSCQLDTVMALAIIAPHGADIHLNETGHQGADTLRDIVSRVSAEPQLRGKVVVSHASCLGKGGGLNSIEVGELDKLLADAGIAIMTNGALGLSAIRRLRAAGVTVFLGCDHVYDLWCGDKLTEPDILGVAATIAGTAESNSGAASNELFDMMTVEVLRGTGLPGSAVIDLGAQADFVVVKDVFDARVTLEHIKSLPRRVFRGGRELIVDSDRDRS